VEAERRPGRRLLGRAAPLLVAAAGALALLIALRGGDGSAGPAVGRAARAVPGSGERIQVEVLNASGMNGLARITTGLLRDAGYDVVHFASDTTDALDSTQVIVRRGNAEHGERVLRALGTGRLVTAPDPSRLVDVSVRAGGDLATRFRDP
jgi:hypothetical protein